MVAKPDAYSVAPVSCDQAEIRTALDPIPGPVPEPAEAMMLWYVTLRDRERHVAVGQQPNPEDRACRSGGRQGKRRNYGGGRYCADDCSSHASSLAAMAAANNAVLDSRTVEFWRLSRANTG
jgi:hypothetical protein